MKKPNRHITTLITLLLGTIFFVSGCAGGGNEQPGEQAPGAQVQTLPIAQAGDEVVAEGEVVPVRSVELKFELGGVVDAILVEEGSTVKADTQLARLDTRDLVLAEEEAKAQLAQSKADYDQLIEGATPEEIAIAKIAVEIAQANLDTYEAMIALAQSDVRNAEADVARAQGQLMQVRGAVTPEDIAAAHASLEYARLQLADELDGPKVTDVQQSQAALDQANATLKERRDTLSKAKTAAYLEMEVAANTLRDRQAGYSRVYWDNRNIEKNFSSVTLDLPQQYKDNEEANLRNVENAEIALQQAQINYENARLAEITGVQVAEANVRQLQAQHADLIDGSDPDVIAGAKSNVASSEANLAALQGEKRTGDLMVAEAGVTSAQVGIERAMTNVSKAQTDREGGFLSVKRAQAELDKVIADPRKSDLDRSLAIVQQREVALKKTALNLE
jgi:HlyD family secretion protein